MITLDMEQGTPEWHQARLGVPTASMMSCIITAGGKASTQAKTYMYQLLADLKKGSPCDAFEGNKFTEIGTEREADSRALYEFITGDEVEEVGFVFLNKQRRVGCSPDGLVGKDGLVEFKNPKGSTIMKYAFETDTVPSEYKVQVQAQLWITGRKWCDFMVAHPDIGHLLIRVERDEEFIKKMKDLTMKFIKDLAVKKKKLPELFNY